MTNFYKLRNRRSRKSAGFSTTTWLIIITLIISIASFLLISLTEENLEYLALKPTNILQGKFLWTLATHMFVHAGFLHLFVNMFVLFSLGSLCERIIGKKRYLWFYLLSGLAAGILSVLLSGLFGSTELGARIFGSPEIFMVGASGAIFAIAGLYVILLPRLKFMIIFLPFFSFPAYIMIPLALFGLWIVSVIFNLPFGNVAHFGGFMTGILYGVYLRAKYKRKVLRLQNMFR